MAAADIKINVMNPRILESLELVWTPITFLLLPIWRMMAMSTGAVRPYSMAVYKRALTGLIPKKSNDRPTSSEMIMDI